MMLSMSSNSLNLS